MVQLLAMNATIAAAKPTAMQANNEKTIFRTCAPYKIFNLVKIFD
jgi:hypothetical protein